MSRNWEREKIAMNGILEQIKAVQKVYDSWPRSHQLKWQDLVSRMSIQAVTDLEEQDDPEVKELCMKLIEALAGARTQTTAQPS